MSAQLALWNGPTVAQYVYSIWSREMLNASPETYHPVRVTRITAERLGIDETLVERIVRVQSRWEARRVLRNIS